MPRGITAANVLVCIAVAGVLVLFLIMALREISANSGGVCDRTNQVRAAIATTSGASACGQVTTRHLREITSLDLSNQSIETLKEGDFDGLVRLQTLDLSYNSLTALPSGVFDELYLLKTLRLNNNQLATVPADIFDELFLLEELTLTGNPDLALPPVCSGTSRDLRECSPTEPRPTTPGTIP